MKDITVIYLTANEISEYFQRNMLNHLLKAVGEETPVIFATKKPLSLHMRFNATEMVFDTPRSHVNIYAEALSAAHVAKTKYIAIAEDDVLYSPKHFEKRPTRPDVFAYNVACWSIYTWTQPPLFSYTGRRNFGQLICERNLFIQAMEERFAKYPNDSKINNALWAEPGKYEEQLGVTVRMTELFYTDPANIMYTHPEGLSFHTLGTRKRLAPIRALEIPEWGRAEDVLKLYE